ncbi:MAG: HAD family hydrolase [Thermoplasmatota archaeon]
MDGVVFDFDGVIADSMGQHAQAYRQALAPLGITVEDADVFLREGARSETIIRDLAGNVDVAALSETKQRIFRELGDVSLYPGVERIPSLQERVATGLVTGTRLSNLERLIPELLPGFRAVLSQEHYTRDKPDPEPYTQAAKHLNIPPARLICIENAVRGIQSARAAGYGHIIAIASTMPREALPADVVAANLHEALDLAEARLS